MLSWLLLHFCFGLSKDLKPQPCLPPKVPHFTGRKRECDEITGHLASGSTRIVSIWGSPGFGKTSVSIAVGHQLHSQGWPVYYFSLRGLQSKADLASQLLSFFGRHATTGQQNPLSFDDELFKVLSDISHPFTIILDDADDLLSGGSEMKEDFTHFLAEILRRTEKLTIVITRRECLEFLNVQFQGHKAVRISRLDETSSQTLVSELLPKATVSDCQRVTNICGHLPLAMKLLCSFISEDDAEHCRVLDDFVLSLQNHNIVEMLDNPDYPSDLRLKLLFDSSFQRLSGQEKEALVSLCVLPESFDLTVAAAVLGTSQGEARRVLQTLRRKSLLESSSKPETFLMHQLILSFAKQRGENEMKEVILKSKVRLCAFYISRFESLNEQFLTGHSMSAFIDFYKDEQSITQSLIEGSSDFETAKQVFEVLVNADVFLYSLYRGKRSTFCKIYDSAKKAAKMLENKNFYRQLLISRALSQVTSVTRSGPMELISDAKDLEESCTPVSDSDRGKRLCYNGIYHLANGRPDDGVQCLEDAVSSMNSSPEKKILRIIACQILAIYHRYKVNLLEMSQFYSKALQECKELGDTQLLVIPEGAGRCDKEDLNPKNSDTSNNQPLKNDIISFVNGATKQLCDNDTKEALTNAVLNIAEQIKEPTVQSSLGLFNFQNNVMTSLRQLRKYEDAAELSVSRISFHETTLEKSHGSKTQYTGREESVTSPTLKQEELAKSYSADASIHYKIHNYSEALKSDQRALEIRLERFGKEHQSTADSYHSLGRTQHRKGEFTSALQSKQRALDIRRKRFGEENSKTADSYHSIGRTQLALNDFSSARQSAQRALDIRLKLFGEENASTAESYQLLGATQHAQNDFSSALQSAQSALQIRLKIFGQQHPSTADSYYSLWVTQHKQRDYSSALQSAQSALQIRIDVCGKEHPSTADSYHSLGVTQHELGDVSTARHSAQRALDIRRKLFGEDDSSTVESDRLLKATECRLGDFSSTPHPTQRPRDIRLTRDKEEHSITADTYYSLGDTKLEKDDLCSASQSAPHAIDNWLKLSGEEHSSKGKGYDSSADTHAQGDLS